MRDVLLSGLEVTANARSTATWHTNLNPVELLLACNRRFHDEEVKIIVEGTSGERHLTTIRDFEAGACAPSPAVVSFLTDQWVLRWRKGTEHSSAEIEFAALPNYPVNVSILRQMIAGTRA